ncbi:putative membrane protein YesL [Evansella vedderi]|uniref:Membrane protein YesL n=1 Tax=Evansella vedderi TaxID=38282 RepID=A0ABT9ZPR6_9BACI|nr:DUF624 domain-containing protein [Evansella vedderi]MDQ0253236.1 putative membrane protein YesL [Evansella vedderi]
MNRVFVFAEWLYELLKLHFYWIVYILKGFVVLGIFPSTAAMYSVVRHWLRDEYHEEQSKLYKKFYSENFVVANIYGWMLTATSGVIALNVLFIPYYTDTLKIIMYAIIIFFTILLIILWSYTFPVIAHYALPTKNYFLVILKTGVFSITATIMQLLLLGIYLFIIYFFPPLVILFGITPFVIVQMAISNNIFRMVDRAPSKES